MFVLYGFVMNTVPQWSLRVAFQKSLFTWWGLFIFFFLRRGSTVYNHHTCTVSSGDDHHATMIFSSCRFDGLDGWYLEVFFVRSGYAVSRHVTNTVPPWFFYGLHHDLWGTRSPKRLVVMSIVVIGLCGLVIHIHSHDTWSTLTPEVSVVMIAVVLCYLCSLTGRRPVCAKYVRRGPVMFRFSLGLARGPQKPMVVEMDVYLQVSFLWPCKSVFFTLSLFWSDVVSWSLGWTLIYLLCMVLWWTLHHHDLWGTLLQKLCLICLIFLKCSWRALLHLFCVVPWWSYHHYSCRSHSFLRSFFVKETQRLFHCMCFIVWLLDKHIALWHFKNSCFHSTKICEVSVDQW